MAQSISLRSNGSRSVNRLGQCILYNKRSSGKTTRAPETEISINRQHISPPRFALHSSAVRFSTLRGALRSSLNDIGIPPKFRPDVWGLSCNCTRDSLTLSNLQSETSRQFEWKFAENSREFRDQVLGIGPLIKSFRSLGVFREIDRVLPDWDHR